MQHYLVLHGRATVTEGGAGDLLRRLAKIYDSPDAEFPLPPDPPPGFVVRIVVDRVGGFGPGRRPDPKRGGGGDHGQMVARQDRPATICP